MRSLFVMDPLEKIRVAGDSTFVTMREHTDRGFPTWFCTPDQMYAREGRTFARTRSVRTVAAPPHFEVGEPEDLGLGVFDVVWMRKDPPFDMRYVFATYLLDMVPAPTLVVNGAHGLKLFNEKMWVMAEWPHLQPPTIVTNDIARVRSFVATRPGRVVLKPWDGNGGRGVLVTQAEDRNLPSMVELLTDDGRNYVIAQDFVPEVEQGDKRILLFDGEPVGAMLRVPTSKDHRANMHAGGEVRACELEPSDLAICAELAPALRRWGMVFVGIDVIGRYLTEINVTSPTGLREMNRLYGWKLEADLVDRVAARCADRQPR
jgi:glutathione synthase